MADTGYDSDDQPPWLNSDYQPVDFRSAATKTSSGSSTHTVTWGEDTISQTPVAFWETRKTHISRIETWMSQLEQSGGKLSGESKEVNEFMREKKRRATVAGKELGDCLTPSEPGTYTVSKSAFDTAKTAWLDEIKSCREKLPEQWAKSSMVTVANFASALKGLESEIERLERTLSEHQVFR